MNAAEPRIVDSVIAADCHIGQLSEVLQSELRSGAKVFRMVRAKGSVVGQLSCVGDCSCLDFSTLADHVRIGRFNHLLHAELGERSYTGPQTVIIKASVGKYCSISWGVTIGGADHDYTRLTTHSFLYSEHDDLRPEHASGYDRFATPCKVGNDVWIGANATIVRDVTVADGAVIGANSVVTRDVPPYAIVAGVPARVLKLRFDQAVIARLLELKWWDFPKAVIRDNFDLFISPPDARTLEKLEAIAARQ
jgi:virginiamycin A acetyltransferase